MLDEIDSKIIEMLLENSRISNIEIAKKIKRSESTVRQRIKKLSDKGIIKKFSILVNPTAIGKLTEAYVGINAHPNRLLKIISFLTEIDGIIKISTTTGDYMIVCEIWSEKGKDLAKIIDKIEEIDGITEVLPSIIQEKYKEHLNYNI